MTDMQSENINELAKALAIAQGQIKSAAKDATNPHFKNNYATLASIWDACREPLSKNGLAIIQQHVMADGLQLCTTLAHSSGQWMKSYLPVIPTQNTPQGLGSAITYMRRYALASIAGVAPDDDDGNAGSEKPEGTYGASGNQRSTSPAVNQWHSSALADIGKAADMKELEKVYKLAVKHGKASNCTDDQLLMLEQQKDARKAFLQGAFAEKEIDQDFERQIGEEG